MGIQKDLTQLLHAGIITQETADNIEDFYKSRTNSSSHKLLLVFGILGAILVGLGIILILAHNWDELSRTIKTFFAFLPLVIGQLICLYSILYQKDNATWNESSAAFLFFAVGASISLVSQIYHIPGNLSSFLLTWMILCFPLIYLMKSSITVILYICGITYYAFETGYSYSPPNSPLYYWPLFLLVLPHYYKLIKNKPQSNFISFLHWILAISILIALGTLSNDYEELMFIAYSSALSIFYLVGQSSFFKNQKLRNNGYKILGSLGIVILCLILSFDWFWEDLLKKEYIINKVLMSIEFYAVTIFSITSISLLIHNWRKKLFKSTDTLAYTTIILISIFLLGLFTPASMTLVNLTLLIFGIFTISQGATEDNLGKLNFGLIMIAALVICRFFDSNISYIVRGLLFVSVGAGFFAGNYMMLTKRRNDEN